MSMPTCRLPVYGCDHAGLLRQAHLGNQPLGRDVPPIMNEVAKLSGGHRPFNFVHRLADGSRRDVQTYAGRWS